jgi:hypothetical protein
VIVYSVVVTPSRTSERTISGVMSSWARFGGLPLLPPDAVVCRGARRLLRGWAMVAMGVRLFLVAIAVLAVAAVAFLIATA